MANATKTICQRLHDRSEIAPWLVQTKLLYNRIAQFYFDLLQTHPDLLDLSTKDALTALEQLTHTTKDNPAPLVPLLALGQEIPAYFRRAAIHAALGVARTLATSYTSWQAAKAKAEARKKPFHQRPPVAPRRWNHSPVLYKEMWKGHTNQTVMLKLFDGHTWRWVRFALHGRAVPDGWEAGSPALVCQGPHWALHIPVTKSFEKPEKAAVQVHTGTRICAVDLNLGDQVAVCTILNSDATTVLATRFIGGNRQRNGRRKCLLGRIAIKRRSTGIIAQDERDNADCWKLVRDLDEDAAQQISHRIVQFAHSYDATIIVFEHLVNLQPSKERYSRAANTRRQYWLKGRIFRYTRDKAWREGILTCRVSPWKTSQRCAACDHEVARYREGEPPEGYQMGAPLFLCPQCGKRGHADHNAAQQIGRRLYQRYRGKAS